jgi:hypothetical protein
MAKKKIRELRGGELFDLLSSSPNGLTREEVCDDTDWSGPQFRDALQWLRDNMATGDTISVIAEPQGQYLPWVYRLVGGAQVVDGEATGWVKNRWGDIERRLTTLMSVLAVAVRATDGRTTLGQKARILQRHLTRAWEDIQLVNENGPTE